MCEVLVIQLYSDFIHELNCCCTSLSCTALSGTTHSPSRLVSSSGLVAILPSVRPQPVQQNSTPSSSSSSRLSALSSQLLLRLRELRMPSNFQASPFTHTAAAVDDQHIQRHTHHMTLPTLPTNPATSAAVTSIARSTLHDPSQLFPSSISTTTPSQRQRTSTVTYSASSHNTTHPCRAAAFLVQLSPSGL